MKDYAYPIDYTIYNVQEVAVIIKFLSIIEDLNEGIKVNNVLESYNNYRRVLNSISAEKKMDRDFYELSGYSIFQTMKGVLS